MLPGQRLLLSNWAAAEDLNLNRRRGQLRVLTAPPTLRERLCLPPQAGSAAGAAGALQPAAGGGVLRPWFSSGSLRRVCGGFVWYLRPGSCARLGRGEG